MRSQGAVEDNTRGGRPRLHTANVRKTVRRYGLVPKVPQKVHINRASKEVVRSWQYRFGRRVSCPEEKGFTILDMDEAFFIHDAASGRKYWSPRGGRIVVPYAGNYRRTVACGAIARGGRRRFRTRGLFDAPTFVWYLKELQRHFGKVER